MIDAIAAAQSNQNPRTENLARQADKSGSYMQMEDFLQLLTSQISNQDPFGTDEGHRIYFLQWQTLPPWSKCSILRKASRVLLIPKRYGCSSLSGTNGVNFRARLGSFWFGRVGREIRGRHDFGHCFR